MIVRHFLQWVRTASAADRADATSALARAFLYSDLTPNDRIAERFGELAAIREALLARDDLSAAARQALVVKLSAALTGFIVGREWLEENRARNVVRDACEKATVTIAAGSARSGLEQLVAHLRQSAQLTPGLMLRALLSGNLPMFEQALAELSGLPLARVTGLLADRRGAGLKALYDRTGLPAAAYPAVRAALAVMDETGFAGEPGGASRLKRRMIERVL